MKPPDDPGPETESAAVGSEYGAASDGIGLAAPTVAGMTASGPHVTAVGGNLRFQKFL